MEQSKITLYETEYLENLEKSLKSELKKLKRIYKNIIITGANKENLNKLLLVHAECIKLENKINNFYKELLI